jgi:hypothetical protein
MTARPQGRCLFCGEREVTREHIWNEWLQKLLPAAGDRIESWFSCAESEFIPEPDCYEVITRPGAVHTKVSRKYWSNCNGGWMREMGEVAQPLVERAVSMGHLFTLVIVHSPPLPGAAGRVITLYKDYLASIQPITVPSLLIPLAARHHRGVAALRWCRT